MYEVRNDYYANLLAQAQKGPKKRRFIGGNLETLRKITESEWEKAKQKALRLQPEDL